MMNFEPESYRLPDKPGMPFIDPDEINEYLNQEKPDDACIEEIVEMSINKNRLSMREVASLILADTPEQILCIKEGATKLKENVYGNRIVLFAPLYVGSHCTNDCQYCGFRTSNKQAQRSTLSDIQLVEEVKALEENGQKRLILVFGEHPKYNAKYIADTAQRVYSIKQGNGEIRRVNINAAPLSVEGFKTVAEAGIGTYQVFQETYHPKTYRQYHPHGKKADYNNRLIALDHAQEAGLDDVGIGALFGLYDWRFEVLGLVRHTNHLEACYNVGPHTISFPRLQEASEVKYDSKYLVSDEEFTRLIAILRLAVPYTGLILTARENAAIRKEVMRYGVSQIDGETIVKALVVRDMLIEQFGVWAFFGGSDLGTDAFMRMGAFPALVAMVEVVGVGGQQDGYAVAVLENHLVVNRLDRAAFMKDTDLGFEIEVDILVRGIFTAPQQFIRSLKVKLP